MEDIVAVDCGGGGEFREALIARYKASEPFQRLLRQMDWFWGIGGLLLAIGVTLVIFLNPSEPVSFAVGWSVPFVWGAIWALITIPWVKRSLAVERRAFQSHGVYSERHQVNRV
jgi:membrane protein YdbS with pleckstrin-like domain